MSALFKNFLSTRSDKSYDPLTVFAFMLGIYGLINCLYYFSLTGPFKYLTLVSSLALLIFPHRPLSVAAFGLSSVAEYIYIAPVYSNHLIIAFLISFYISFLIIFLLFLSILLSFFCKTHFLFTANILEFPSIPFERGRAG